MSSSSRDHAPTPGDALEWRPMDTAPGDARLLVNFRGAGAIVAYRDPEYPDYWVRYLGYGKSQSWPTIHADYALNWMAIPAVPSSASLAEREDSRDEPPSPTQETKA